MVVPEFSIDAYPVTNAEYLRIRCEPAATRTSFYWKPEDWEWKQTRSKLTHPHFWLQRIERACDGLPIRNGNTAAMFGTIPLPPSWPVLREPRRSLRLRALGRKKTSHRSAMASRRLWHAGRARARLSLGRLPRQTRRHGNFHHERWDADRRSMRIPRARARSACSTCSATAGSGLPRRLRRCPDSKPFSFYPGYSANFFDGKHFVMKGGSPRTDACMLRRSFRNWFQPHYPHVYATFRCVEE